jgi:hypothetical protein
MGRLNRAEQRAAIFYLHPWEVDPDQPRVDVNWLSRVRHYRHLDKTEPRLRRLLGEFAFGAIDTLIASLAGEHTASGRVLAAPAEAACHGGPGAAAGARQPC